MKKILITAALMAGTAAWAQQPPTQSGSQPHSTSSQPAMGQHGSQGTHGSQGNQGNHGTMNHGTMQHGTQGSMNQGSMNQGQSGTWTGQGGPDEAVMRTYPRCSRTVRDRCTQPGGR